MFLYIFEKIYKIYQKKKDIHLLFCAVGWGFSTILWEPKVLQCWLIIYCQSKEQAVQFISSVWVVVDQVDLCPRSFTQQETAPAVQRSGQRPDLNLEFLWKFVTSRMLIKKVSGRAGLICNSVVAL